MTRPISRLLAPMVLAAVGACTTQTELYGWGNYEELIYVSYAEPGSLAPEAQIQAMEQDYQKMRAANRRAPPGWHAQLGYLYAQAGKPAEAERELLVEKAAFPESAVMIDSLLANLRRQ